MRIAVGIIGWLIVAEGVLFLIRPEFLGPVIRLFSDGFWMYALSVLRIALAVVFFVGAIQCRLKGVLVSFGILMLIVGVAGLIVKRRMYNTMLQWWQERNLVTVRLLAAVVMLIGAAIVYSV